MDMTPISTLPKPAKIISLSVARNKYRPGHCQHNHMTIDEDLATVKCDDCGEKLNPVAMLLRFANEESQWQRRSEELRQLHRDLDARIRCKNRPCHAWFAARVAIGQAEKRRGAKLKVQAPWAFSPPDPE